MTLNRSMIVITFFSLSALLLTLNLSVPTTHADRAVPPAEGTASTSDSGPLVLELFTSQGCSSCPPADRLLTELSGSDNIIALSFHVDYWNYIGWRDPFSSSRWSDRQRRYARALEYGRVYTPQLVVDGRGSCVGSQRDQVERLLADARNKPRHGRVALEVARTPDGRSLAVAARGDVVAGDRPLTLYLAVYETDLETPVKAGENARRTLRNDHVVRHFESGGKATSGRPVETAVEIPIESSWKANKLGVVAFLQDAKTLEIHGAARSSVL